MAFAGGTRWTRSATTPASAYTGLVTTQIYNAAALVDTTTDPRRLLAKACYDNLGQTTMTIEAYADSTPTDNTNKTVEYAYDGDNRASAHRWEEWGDWRLRLQPYIPRLSQDSAMT